MTKQWLVPFVTRFGRFGSAVIVLVLVQTLLLTYFIADRVMILRSPNVVTLLSEPVDPRDLFRGDYVTLGYAITTLSLTEINGDQTWADGETIYVELTPAENNWRAVAAFHAHEVPALGNKIIRGTISYYDTTRNVAQVDYGIERYYVPEGEGRVLEEERNKSALSVDVALGRDGEATIKGIRIDGKPVYEEPVF
ncbi:MAG: GDYXXLXY domain-containing protein [Parvibaculum sp.]|nr:GDYXXLXY domain-containing protein [Parvibaculum sp.]